MLCYKEAELLDCAIANFRGHAWSAWFMLCGIHVELLALMMMLTYYLLDAIISTYKLGAENSKL